MAKNIFSFRCGACRKNALTVTLSNGKAIVQSPLKESTFHSSKKIPRIRKALNERNLVALDSLLELDNYCPECDKVYCDDHIKYNLNIDSTGWYDDADVSCPKGHTRVVD